MMKQRFWLAALLVFASAIPVLAQRSTATVRGTVTDTTGGVLPGATVTIKSDETGFTRSTTTNTSGLYSFNDVPVGTYNVEVTFTGFKTAVRSKVGLNVADVRALDFQLSTGDLSESVNVESPAVAVQTIGGEVAGLITGEQVRELPLNGRNFLQLATLMPGVSTPDGLNLKDKGLLSGSDLSISGAAVTANLWTVDGTNNNDVGSNRTILVYPSVDAIEEFKIHRNSYGAEFGQAAGAQINIVTRGGTNEFHGGVSYFGRRDALNSKNYFLEQANRPKENLTVNNYAWHLGGPIVKDKLHFFASQEWNREQRGTVRTAFVPTAAERAGDFSGPRIENCTGQIPTDPLTGVPFPGNQIPANRLSPGGLLYLQLYPLPNTTPTGGSCNNWVDSLDSPINWRQENIRLDWSITNTTRLMLRYTQDSWENLSPSVNTNLWGDDSFPAVDSDWDQPGKSFIAQLNHNVGSNGTNSLSFSYSGNKINIDRGGTNPELNSQLLAAIPTIFPLAEKQYGQDTGHPLFWGGGGYQALWNEAPFRNNQDLYIVKDDYSAVFGKHFVKAGILASTNAKNEDSRGNGSDMNSKFWGSGGLPGWGSNSGNILSDFLLRDMTFGFSEQAGFRSTQTRWKDLEFYVQDSWKIKPRVTFDYGVRYSLLFNYYAKDDTITSFVPDLFNPALGNDPCNGLVEVPGTSPCADAGFQGGAPGPNRSLQDTKYDAIAPRVGLAWDVSGNGRTAVRAGFGRFFLRERLSGGLSYPNNPPFGRTQSGLRTLDSNAEPCGGCFSTSAGVPTSGRELRAVLPSTWQWNLSVQHEVFRNSVLEVGYVGSKGVDQLQFYDANQVPAANRAAYARSQPADASLRPYGVFGDTDITIWAHDGETSYHSLQTQFVSRFGRGSQFQTSYTWSKSLGNIGLDDSGGIDNDNAVSDLSNRDLDWGRTKTHRTHIFNASLVYVLPSLESKTGLVKAIFGDWEVASIVAAASGSALSVYINGVPGLNGGPSGAGYDNNQRPNVVPGVSCKGSGPKEQILNPAAFTLNGFQLGSIGNAGRGICEGPSLFQVDLSLYKNIKISGRVKAQLRFEMFNVFNRVNFLSSQLNDQNFNPSNATFDTGDPSTATTITGYTLPGTFGQSTATRDARQAQFGIKLMF
jgi:hypothetical protein